MKTFHFAPVGLCCLLFVYPSSYAQTPGINIPLAQSKTELAKKEKENKLSEAERAKYSSMQKQLADQIAVEKKARELADIENKRLKKALQEAQTTQNAPREAKNRQLPLANTNQIADANDPAASNKHTSSQGTSEGSSRDTAQTKESVVTSRDLTKLGPTYLVRPAGRVSDTAPTTQATKSAASSTNQVVEKVQVLDATDLNEKCRQQTDSTHQWSNYDANCQLIAKATGRINGIKNAPLMVVLPVAPETKETGDETVRITYRVAMGKFDVSFEEWDACVKDSHPLRCTHKPKDNGSGRGNRPVFNVSANDIEGQYLKWLNAKAGLKQNSPERYRLPTVAELKYAQAGINKPLQESFEENNFGINSLSIYLERWTRDCNSSYRNVYQEKLKDESIGETICESDDSRYILNGYTIPPSSEGRFVILPGTQHRSVRAGYGFRLVRTLVQ